MVSRVFIVFIFFMFRSCVRVCVFLRGREGWAREYEVKGGVWVFQLKILIFSYLFDDFAPSWYTWKWMLLTFSARLCEFFGYLQILTWQEIETLLFFFFFCLVLSRTKKYFSRLRWFTNFLFILPLNIDVARNRNFTLFSFFAFCFLFSRTKKYLSLCLGWFTIFPFIFEINKFSLLCLGNELIPQFLLSS